MKKIVLAFAAVLSFVTSVSAVSLFEIKDESGNPVLVVSSDGLRILNGADTLMVISTEGIKAFIETDPAKGLSRTFAVTTTSSKGTAADVMNVTTDGMRIYDQTNDSKALGDTLMTISSRSIKAHIKGNGKVLSRTFAVTTTSSKGQTNVLDVNTASTTMREAAGNEYTDFSPENIFLGLNSGGLSTTGSGNTFMGNNAGFTNQSGNSNVFLGEDAGKYYDGSFGNVFIGQQAALNLTGGQRNVMIGYYAGAQPLSSFTSYGNVFVGGAAGRKVSGSNNVMIGEASGENDSLGSDASYSIFLGNNSGRYNTGDYNICIGESAGSGIYSNPLTGNNNIFIGYGADATNIDDDYRFVVGSSYGDLLYGRLDTPKQLVVNGNLTHNENGRTFFVNGSAGGTTAWYNDSDERLKKNIRTVDNALDKVMKLRGVTYEWKDPEKHEKGRKLGFIAQESKEIIPEAVDYNIENDSYSMQYASVTAVLVEAIKELKKEVGSRVAALENKEIESKKVIDGQNEKINILMNENKELKNKLNELESLRAEIDQIKSLISNYTVK